MKPFVFRYFTLAQHPEVFRVGTDGVLLGALSAVGKARHILEVGSGTGLVSLMLAQRNPTADIVAVEISEAAAELTAQNFRDASFSGRMKVIHQDFKTFLSGQKFDCIVSNPPYFEQNESSKHVVARQKKELDFQELIRNAVALLSPGGLFSVIIPSDQVTEFVSASEKAGVHLIRKINIFGIEGGKLRRNILEFSSRKTGLLEEDFTIEKSPGKFTDQYLKCTEEFHVFSKK